MSVIARFHIQKDNRIDLNFFFLVFSLFVWIDRRRKKAMSISVETLKDALDSVKNGKLWNLQIFPAFLDNNPLDSIVVISVNSLNQLSKDHSSWDKGAQACKDLADALREGKYPIIQWRQVFNIAYE